MSAPTPFEIRPLRDADPPWVVSAFAAIGWTKPQALYEQYLAEQQAGRRQVWVAHAGKELVGYVTLDWHSSYPPFQSGGIPEIRDLNVLPDFRRCGLGSALLDTAEAAAAARSRIVGIAVGVGPDYGPAQRLYVRRGYVPDGRGIAWRSRTLSPGEQAVVDDDLVLYFTRAVPSGGALV